MFFSKGKIDVLLNKTFFASREVIEGTVVLELKEPVKSKGVSVSITSQESRTVRRSGKTESEHYTQSWGSQSLDIEKEYPANQRLEYPFKFEAPNLTIPNMPLPGFLKGLVGAMTPSQKQFKVEAKLEISMGLDVNSHRDITVAYTKEEEGKGNI